MDSPAPDEAVDVVHEIYPGGDVLLLCGPSKVMLLVHSIFLTNVSEVFTAILGPNFREGQPQTNGGPREVPLPEDDPFAIRAICNVIHSRHGKLPDTISPKQLLAIAYAADKYDLVSALSTISSQWISLANKAAPHSFRIENSWDAMIAAYILEDDESFHDTTATIVLGYNRSFLDLDLPLGDIMPSDILFRLEEKRNSVRLDLMQLLYRPACVDPNSCRCGWNAKHCHAYMQKIESAELLPENIAKGSLSWTFTKVENMSDPDVVEESANCSSCRWHRKPDWRLSFTVYLTGIKDSAGIRLDTFRTRGKEVGHESVGGD